MRNKVMIMILAFSMLLNGFTFYTNHIRPIFVDNEDEGWSYMEYTKHLA